MTARRDTSADSAARFLASREHAARRPTSPPKRHGVPPGRPLLAACCGFRRQARNLVMRYADGAHRLVCAPGKGCNDAARPVRPPAFPTLPSRIACDFAEPTLRLIHEVLLDAIHAGLTFSDRGALLLIAEQMVATALGGPPCDDPPLSDCEVG